MHRSHTLRVFMACLTVMWSVGCMDTAVEPKRETPVDPAIVANDALVAKMQTWIDRMDPYVSQNADGTFSLDYASFHQQHPNLVGDDLATVEGLRDGIPAQNGAILKDGKGGDSCQSATCWRWWWGMKCCYSGIEAQRAIYLVTIGAIIPGLGAPMIYLAATMQYYLNVYGVFCVTSTINNVTWISH